MQWQINDQIYSCICRKRRGDPRYYWDECYNLIWLTTRFWWINYDLLEFTILSFNGSTATLTDCKEFVSYLTLVIFVLVSLKNRFLVHFCSCCLWMIYHKFCNILMYADTVIYNTAKDQLKISNTLSKDLEQGLINQWLLENSSPLFAQRENWMCVVGKSSRLACTNNFTVAIDYFVVKCVLQLKYLKNSCYFWSVAHMEWAC